MGFHKVKITAPYILCMPSAPDQQTGKIDLINGDENPFFKLVTFLNDSVKFDRYLEGQNYVWNGEMLLEMLEPSAMTTLAQYGVEFYNVPLFMEIDLTANAPDQWRSTDENGDPVDRTWQQYFDETVGVTPMVIGDKTYTGLTPDRRWLPFSEAVALGVTLITKPEINYLQSQQPE